MSTISTSLVSRPSQALSPTTPSSSLHNRPIPSATPSTPTTKPATSTPSPGTFRHPRLTEIISRQSKTTFTETNIRSATLNSAVFLLSTFFSTTMHSLLLTLLTSPKLVTSSTAQFITSTILLLLRLLFLTNIILALRPILPYISSKDTITDIPLTPSQRALLGLPPTPKPTTPTPLSTTSSPTFGTAGYVTPPRYHRSFSPTANNNTHTPSQDYAGSADRRSISAQYSTSPLSTSRYTLGFSPSPSAPQTQPRARTASGSSYGFGSPNAVGSSPLFQKAIRQQHIFGGGGIQDLPAANPTPNSNGNGGPFGRSSFGGFASGLGRSQSVKERRSSNTGSRERGVRDSGSPIAQKGVNYKWLYDKGFPGPGMVKSESMQF